MMNNNDRELIFCSKCDNQIDDNNFKSFECDHLFCYNCIIDYLLKSNTMIIFPLKIFNCIIIGCKGIGLISGDWLGQFIYLTNNEKLIKKI